MKTSFKTLEQAIEYLMDRPELVSGTITIAGKSEEVANLRDTMEGSRDESIHTRYYGAKTA